MKGIILAAGKGIRLNGTEGDDPKCLIKVGEMTLIERQIYALRKSGVGDIVVVVGHRADRVRRVCGSIVEYVENDHFNETNSLYSLWLTRHLLSDGFVVMNSDVLFHSQLLRDLLAAPHEDALLVSYCNGTTPPLGEEEMKVKVRAGLVVDIAKAMHPRDADGENVGIVKFGPTGAALLTERMDALVAAGDLRHWAPRAFLEFANLRPLHAIGTRGYPWIEIDFSEDYRRCLAEVFPMIAATDEEVSEASYRSCDEGEPPSPTTTYVV